MTAPKSLTQISGARKILAAIAVMCVGFTGMGGMGSINALLQSFAEIYAGTSFTVVSLIGTLPLLFVMPFAIFGGFVVNKTGYRPLLIGATALILVFGVLPVFVHDLAFILVCRAFVGLGCGVVLALCPAYVLQLFEGDSRQSTMVGLYGAADGLGGIIMSLLIGVIAIASPYYGFYCYALAAVGLVMVIAFCPELVDRKAVKTETEHAEAAQDGRSKKIPASFWLLALCVFLVIMTASTFSMPSSMAIAEFGIGGISEAATVQSIYNAGGFVMGFVVGFLLKKMKSAFMPTMAGVVFLSFVVITFIHSSFAVFAIIAFCIGFAMNAFNFGCQAYFPQMMDESVYSKATGIWTATFCFSSFFASIWTGILNSAFHTDSVLIYYQVGCVILLITVIICTAWSIRQEKKNRGVSVED